MSITAMKQVKMFLEHLTTHSWTLDDKKKAIELQRQAIEQAEKQKPVAVILEDMKGGGYIDWLDDTYFVPGTKFYTHPQREWVGLTEEEIVLVCAECAASAHNWNDISFARAIEAKLREKNGGKV